MELLIVVAIISIMSIVTLVYIGESRKNARINGTKTTLKNVMSLLMSCNISGGTPSLPANIANDICSDNPGVKWPALPNGYAYGVGNYGYSCSFAVSTNGDAPADLICDCVRQACN